jgi:hypothetical protein
VGLLPLIPSRVGKYTDDILEFLPEPTRKLVGETADTIRGKISHKNYPYALGPGYIYNKKVPGTTIRPDAIDPLNHIVRELKPDNQKAIQRGWKQVQRFADILTQLTGDVWIGIVDTYRK